MYLEPEKKPPLKRLKGLGGIAVILLLCTAVCWFLYHTDPARKMVETDLTMAEYGVVAVRRANVPEGQTDGEEELRATLAKKDGGEISTPVDMTGKWSCIPLREGGGEYTLTLEYRKDERQAYKKVYRETVTVEELMELPQLVGTRQGQAEYSHLVEYGTLHVRYLGTIQAEKEAGKTAGGEPEQAAPQYKAVATVKKVEEGTPLQCALKNTGEWSSIPIRDGDGEYLVEIAEVREDKNYIIFSDTITIEGLEPLSGVVAINSDVQVDTSGLDRGLLRARYVGLEETETVMSTRKGDGKEYLYAINPDREWEMIPLTEGDGEYTLQIRHGREIYETAKSERSYRFPTPITLSLSDFKAPFLEPNQVISYTPDSNCVALAAQITEGLRSDRERVDAIVDYVADHIVYDTEAAELGETILTMKSYDPDEILERGTGICGDYAAVVTAMLRSQGIPCKFVVGEFSLSSDELGPHGWVEAYIKGKWVRKDASSLSPVKKYADDPEKQQEVRKGLLEMIADDNRYHVKRYY